MPTNNERYIHKQRSKNSISICPFLTMIRTFSQDECFDVEFKMKTSSAMYSGEARVVSD